MMRHPSISISILRSIAFSLALLAGALTMQAQTGKQRPSKAEQERLRLKQVDDSIPFFHGVQAGVDAIGLIQMGLSNYGQVEGIVRVNLKDKYFPVIEAGWGRADERNDITQTAFKTSAPYGKIGVDFNLMKNKHDIYRLYAGMRYALTYYKFNIDHADVIDPVWGGGTPFSFHNIKGHYHWLEAVVGIDAKITGPLRLGWTVRYRKRIIHDDGFLGNTWYVPGYGRQGASRLGGTFNIIFEL